MRSWQIELEIQILNHVDAAHSKICLYCVECFAKYSNDLVLASREPRRPKQHGE